MVLHFTFVFFVCNIFNLISPSQPYQYHKRWVRSNSWSEPTNWEPPHLPCPQDNIKLSNDVIFIDNNVTMANGLNLNSDSEIVFGLNANIVFGSGNGAEKKQRTKRSEQCAGSGKEISFVGQQQKSWFNPTNWELIDKNGLRDVYLTNAAPFIERIPCTSDRISFPESGAFEIEISKNASVKEIMVGGALLSSQPQLDSYLKSREGTTRFSLIPPFGSLVVNSEPCSTPPCPCGNSLWKENICSSFKCPVRRTCKRKVKPRNDCCYHCGALIHLSIVDNIDMKNCSAQLRSLLHMRQGYGNVRLYMYVSHSDIQRKMVEVLVSDDHGGLAADMAADTIKEYLASNKSKKSCGGTQNIVKVRTASSINQKDEQEDDESDQVAAAVLLPLFLIGAIIILILFIWYRRRYPKVPKVRFHNELEDFPGYQDIEITQDYTGRDEGPFRSGTITFENPVFDIIEQKEKQKIGSGETLCEPDEDGEGNAVYTSPQPNIYDTTTDSSPPGKNIDDGYVELKLPNQISGATSSLPDIPKDVSEDTRERTGWVTDFDEGQDAKETNRAPDVSDISTNDDGEITSRKVATTETARATMEWVEDVDLVGEYHDDKAAASLPVPSLTLDEAVKYTVDDDLHRNNDNESRNNEKEKVAKKEWVTDFDSP